MDKKEFSIIDYIKENFKILSVLVGLAVALLQGFHELSSVKAQTHQNTQDIKEINKTLSDLSGDMKVVVTGIEFLKKK